MIASGMSRAKKVVMSRLVPLARMNSSFDIQFWQKVAPQVRFAAAWEMVQELPHWNPRYDYQQRLQRSVASLKRRPR